MDLECSPRSIYTSCQPAHLIPFLSPKGSKPLRDRGPNTPAAFSSLRAILASHCLVGPFGQGNRIRMRIAECGPRVGLIFFPNAVWCAFSGQRSHVALGLRVKTVGNGRKKPLTVFTRIIFCLVRIGKRESRKRITAGKFQYIKNG
jgi:hypothetical protein